MTKKMKLVNGNILNYEIFRMVDPYDPIMRTPTIPVDFENMSGEEVSYLGTSLAETCAAKGGLGLAANQVGLNHRMCVVNMIGEDRIWILINPKIIELSETRSKYKEGCLSFPYLYLKVDRADWCVVEFNAFGGEIITQKFDGLTAVVIQHELDHLDGKVFMDRVSPIALQRAKQKIKKNKRTMKNLLKNPLTNVN